MSDEPHANDTDSYDPHDSETEHGDRTTEQTPSAQPHTEPTLTFAEPHTKTYSGFVAILGKPNVGKSTLLNTLLGIKVAPITPKPQTTRRGVRGIYSEDNRQLVFVDTPGVHRAKDALGNYMNREASSALIDVDAVLWVVDLRRPPGEEDRDVARMLNNLEQGAPIYLIGNKLDAAKYPDEALSLYRDLVPDINEAYSLSSLNDPEAVYELRNMLLALLPEGPFYFPHDIRSDQSRENWVAELIRESAMIHLRQELPYAVAVNVIEWRDPEEDAAGNVSDEPIYIFAEIWVERPNHRMIVLGKGGSMIREIGRTARKQLELFLSHKLYLDLEVVIRRSWREDREALRELGYEV
ncbi:MAG: GTPase Era [Trueperaceae bacterium]|nr:GTPase Era [Trueperaceae bacterium]